jgi:hypothetical protein
MTQTLQQQKLSARSEIFWSGCLPMFTILLPYATTGQIAAKNLKNACELEACMGHSLPLKSLCQTPPKGSVGLQCVKELHNDGNAAVIPGISMSVIGDPTVSLCFVGHGMNYLLNYHLSMNHHRFCWFYGWIPHRTEVTGDPSFLAAGAMAELHQFITVHTQNPSLSI